MTAEQRAGLSDAALAMTQPCIDELIRDVSRRIKKAGAITDTAEYQYSTAPKRWAKANRLLKRQ